MRSFPLFCFIVVGLYFPSFGQWDVGQEHQWTASFYAQKFHGRPTASGEIYTNRAFTCAHRTLPFNTMLKISNPSKQKSVIVRVNDRGPFIKNRDIDLSFAAAKALEIISKGIVKLDVTIVGFNGIEELIFWPQDSTQHLINNE